MDRLEEWKLEYEFDEDWECVRLGRGDGSRREMEDDVDWAEDVEVPKCRFDDTAGDIDSSVAESYKKIVIWSTCYDVSLVGV